MGIDSEPRDRRRINRHPRQPISISKRIGLFGILLMVCTVFSYPSFATHPGAYVCAVDNCKKQYRAKGEQLFEACRDGAALAVNSAPASDACMKMCSDTYPGSEGGSHKACNTGCALFPSRCLRFGELPPKDDYARDRRRWD